MDTSGCSGSLTPLGERVAREGDGRGGLGLGVGDFFASFISSALKVSLLVTHVMGWPAFVAVSPFWLRTQDGSVHGGGAEHRGRRARHWERAADGGFVLWGRA